MIFNEDTFSNILSIFKNNPSDIGLLQKSLDLMLEFKVSYDKSKGKSRGKKVHCHYVGCYITFYDFERDNRFCVHHLLTPYSPKFLNLINKVRNSIDKSSREKVFKNINWNYESQIRWLRVYREDRIAALDFKKCSEVIIQNVLLEIETIINKDIVICTVPSSTKGNFNTGINKLTNLLVKKGRLDGTNCLVRHTSRLKSGFGGNRNLQEQLNTISSQNENIISKRVILLLDDVTKTGNSLEACSQILMNNGAIDVFKLAIWKAGIIND